MHRTTTRTPLTPDGCSSIEKALLDAGAGPKTTEDMVGALRHIAELAGKMQDVSLILTMISESRPKLEPLSFYPGQDKNSVKIKTLEKYHLKQTGRPLLPKNHDLDTDMTVQEYLSLPHDTLSRSNRYITPKVLNDIDDAILQLLEIEPNHPKNLTEYLQNIKSISPDELKNVTIENLYGRSLLEPKHPLRILRNQNLNVTKANVGRSSTMPEHSGINYLPLQTLVQMSKEEFLSLKKVTVVGSSKTKTGETRTWGVADYPRNHELEEIYNWMQENLKPLFT
jgi:hypothetical protein